MCWASSHGHRVGRTASSYKMTAKETSAIPACRYKRQLDVHPAPVGADAAHLDSDGMAFAYTCGECMQKCSREWAQIVKGHELVAGEESLC